MSCDRYLLIKRGLHFSRNPEMGQPQPENRLYKIRPVVNYFGNKMKEVYFPDKKPWFYERKDFSSDNTNRIRDRSMS